MAQGNRQRLRSIRWGVDVRVRAAVHLEFSLLSPNGCGHLRCHIAARWVAVDGESATTTSERCRVRDCSAESARDRPGVYGRISCQCATKRISNGRSTSRFAHVMADAATSSHSPRLAGQMPLRERQGCVVCTFGRREAHNFGFAHAERCRRVSDSEVSTIFFGRI